MRKPGSRAHAKARQPRTCKSPAAAHITASHSSRTDGGSRALSLCGGHGTAKGSFGLCAACSHVRRIELRFR
jgi:hypothetical protein